MQSSQSKANLFIANIACIYFANIAQAFGLVYGVEIFTDSSVFAHRMCIFAESFST
jgi:hypothetical protein